MNRWFKLQTFLVFLLIAIVVSSCAAQSKYKKRGAVPCPCEKNNKR
jgi:hypothetical protein